MNVHEAAATLHKQIPAPRGAVNTLALSDSNGPLIRVLVDPSSWSVAELVPTIFEGYRVTVERRQTGSAFH